MRLENVNAFAVSPASVATSTPDASGNEVSAGRANATTVGCDTSISPTTAAKSGIAAAVRRRSTGGGTARDDGVERGAPGSRGHRPAVVDAGQRGDPVSDCTLPIVAVSASINSP